MSRPRSGIGSELIPLILVLACLAGSSALVVSIHRREIPRRLAKPVEPVALPPSSPTPEPEKLPPPPVLAMEEDPEVEPTPLPTPVDPTPAVVAKYTSAEAEQLLEASRADRKAEALERARKDAEAEAERFRRRESLVHAQLDSLDSKVRKLEANAEELALERDALQKERDSRKAAVAQASSRPNQAILPHKGLNGTWRRPIIVECRNGMAILQPLGIEFSLMELESGFGPSSNPFAASIAREAIRVQRKATPDGQPVVPYIFFVVRPDGIRPYYEARGRLEPLGITFGYELADQDWDIAFPNLDDTSTWDGSAPRRPAGEDPLAAISPTTKTRTSGSPAEDDELTAWAEESARRATKARDAGAEGEFNWPARTRSGTASDGLGATRLPEAGISPRPGAGQLPGVEGDSGVKTPGGTPGQPDRSDAQRLYPGGLADASSGSIRSEPQAGNGLGSPGTGSGDLSRQNQPSGGRSEPGSGPANGSAGVAGNGPSGMPMTGLDPTGPTRGQAGGSTGVESPSPAGPSGLASQVPAAGPGKPEADPGTDFVWPGSPAGGGGGPKGRGEAGGKPRTDRSETRSLALPSTNPGDLTAASPSSSRFGDEGSDPNKPALLDPRVLEDPSQLPGSGQPGSNSGSSSDARNGQPGQSTTANGSGQPSEKVIGPGSTSATPPPQGSPSLTAGMSSPVLPSPGMPPVSSPPNLPSALAAELLQQKAKPGLPPPVDLPQGSVIDRSFEVVVVCSQRGAIVQPGGYRITADALRDRDGLFKKQIVGLVKARRASDPKVKLEPRIRFLVLSGGYSTYQSARTQFLLSGLDWPSSTQVADPDPLSTLPVEAW